MDVGSSTIWLTPGQIASRAGVAVSTLHYYEQLGLIRSRRTAGNRRQYRRDTLRVVAFVRASQSLGIPLARIKSTLDELPDGDPPTKRDWARIARLWRSDLEERIQRLQRLRDNLSNCIGCGCLSLTSCPYTNPGDRMQKEGPGAHLL